MSTTWRAVPTKAPPVVFYLFISVGLVSGWLALIDHFTIGFLIFFLSSPGCQFNPISEMEGNLDVGERYTDEPANPIEVI